ncbi:hypothetical protein [Vibrio phage VP16C]|nr:hypothetical protein [Vibrio phage VP16C]
MFKKIKVLYWQWVVGCAVEDIQHIDNELPYLNPLAKTQALRERRQAINDLITARERLLKLEG